MNLPHVLVIDDEPQILRALRTILHAKQCKVTLASRGEEGLTLAPAANALNHYPIPPAFWIGLVLYAPAIYSFERLRKMFNRRPQGARNAARVGKEPL